MTFDTGQRPIAIFGGRGAGILAAHALRRAQTPSPVICFLNDAETMGVEIEGIPVVGSFDGWAGLSPETGFLAPLHKANQMEERARRVESLGVPFERWVNIIDPAALVVDGSIVGSGTWVQAGAMVMPGARVGSHVALRSGCHVSHDCVVEDFANVGIGAILCGYSVVETGAYVAAGAVVRDGVHIGRYSVVGLGAVVVADVPPGAVVVGNPARVMRRNE